MWTETVSLFLGLFLVISTRERKHWESKVLVCKNATRSMFQHDGKYTTSKVYHGGNYGGHRLGRRRGKNVLRFSGAMGKKYDDIRA